MEVTLTMRRVFVKGLIAFEVPHEDSLRAPLAKVLTACRNKHSDYVQVTIKPPYKRRTTGPASQNHHLNGHIVQLCNETGYTYDEVKYCVKMRAVELFGYPYKMMCGYIVPKGERDCNTEECGMLIEASHVLAAEWGFVLREE